MLVDIDGVLADMSAFTAVLNPGDGTKHWQQFFGHISDATLINTGAELVHALAHVGARVQYSTTRPASTTRATLDWITAQDLPAGRLYARGSRKTTDAGLNIPVGGPAVEVKQAHCALIDDRHGLAAFIDDEPDMITALCAAGYPGLHTSDLNEATTSRLRQLTQHRPNTVT